MATKAVILGSAILVVCLGFVSGPLFELLRKLFYKSQCAFGFINQIAVSD